MEESQSKPHRSQRLTSQPSLTPEVKPFQTKRTRLTRSKSPRLVGTSTPTSSETLVTLNISRIPTSTKEIPKQQQDIATNPSVTVNTSIPRLVPSTVDSEGVTPQPSTATEITYSSAPKYLIDLTVCLFLLD